jgi:hypothetical protein
VKKAKTSKVALPLPRSHRSPHEQNDLDWWGLELGEDNFEDYAAY